MRNNPRHVALLVIFTLLAAGQAFAQPVAIQGPNLGGMDKATLVARQQAIRINRGQGLKPAFREAMITRLRSLDVSSAEFQSQISQAAPQVRTAVFAAKASEQGTPAAIHTRRLRGMLVQGKKNKVAHSSKQLVEVTPDNFDLFRKIAGGNMVWFSVNDSPGHLHTLLADQGGGDRFHHNTYGVTTDTATITANYTQYSMGVQLTDREMDRLVRYMNTASAANAASTSYTTPGGTVTGKIGVFGFYNKQKQRVTDIRCTNWVTSAPIGELPRWATTLEKRISKLAEAGQLQTVPEIAAAGNSLHAALAAAAPEARADLVRRVLAVQGLGKWNKGSVKRLAKVFKKELADFPGRPADLVLRTSMAQTLGLSRSQDPAKWSYDLLLSKRVPVVAVLNDSRDANLPGKTLNWEIMGAIDATGRVVANPNHYGSDGGRGIIPADRLPRQPPVQPTQLTPTQPAATTAQ